MAATGEPNMVIELDKVRKLVHSYGYLDEGSFEQAAEIIASLPIAVWNLEQAIYFKYPEIRDAANEGII